MKNFKESIAGLLEQMDYLIQSVADEKESTDLAFKDLLLLLSALLDSIKEKIIIEQEEIKKILNKVKPITDHLVKRKHISKARQYHDEVISLCKDLNINELKSIESDHHLSISKLNISPDIIVTHEFIEEKENIDDFLDKLNHFCQAASIHQKNEEKSGENEISTLKLKLINAANIQLVNLYPIPDEPVEKKAVQLQQKAIENIIFQSAKPENKAAGCHFIYRLIQKTLKTKCYDVEWKKNLLCCLFYAYQLRKPDSDEKEDWKIHRIQLKESREKLNQQFSDGHLVGIDTEKRIAAAIHYSEAVKKLLQDIATRCTNLIYPPPGAFEFCLVALGSITRKELLPYSDLECLLLTSDRKDADWESQKASPAAKYLEIWFKLFQFYIVSFGESLEAKPGFRLDGYCDKTGLTNLRLIKGNPCNPEFRKTVGSVIEALHFATQDQASSTTNKAYTDPYSLYSLLSPDYIHGNDQMKLFNDYHKKIQELTEDSQEKFSQKIAISQLKMFNQLYQKINDDDLEKTTSLNIKQHYWQLLIYPLYSLTLYHNLIKFYDSKNTHPPKSTADIISLLEKNKLFKPEEAKKFQIILSDLYQIRFKLHQNAEFQKESYDSKSEIILEKADLENLDSIKNKFLKEFYNAIAAFLKTKLWSLKPLPRSYEDMLEIWKNDKEKYDAETKSQNEKIKTLEKQMGQQIKESTISITPVYYILADYSDKYSLSVELEKKTDSTCRLQSYIIAYLDDQKRLMLWSMLYSYGKKTYNSEYSIEILTRNSVNQKSSPPKIESRKKQELRPMKTEGNGDCPFHAVLGEWNESKKKYICAELEKHREKVETEICKIVENKEECKPLQDLVIAGIKAAIMDGIFPGTHSNILLKSWREFEENQKNSKGWDKFHGELKKYPDIMDFINKHGSSSSEFESSKYHVALTKEDKILKAMILSLKDLETARCAYDLERSQGFDWNSNLNAEIKKEYGRYIGKKGTWMLPHELGIIAIVFKVSVHCYATHNAIPQIYNPDQKKIVHVQYRRRQRHYERLEYVESRGSAMEETALNTNSVKQYLHNELKIYEMERQTVHDITEPEVDNYGQVSFNQFYNFYKIKSKLQPRQRNEALMKLLRITIENHGDRLSFARTVHSDREKYAILSGGQTIQFKFAWQGEKKAEEEVIEEISKLNKGYKILTVVFDYSKDKPALTGYIQSIQDKNKNLKKYRISSAGFMKCLQKYISNSNFDLYKKQIEQFWMQPGIMKKWQEASIKLIEEEKWLIHLYNNFQKIKKIESGYIKDSWAQVLQRSASESKSLRIELQADKKLKPILYTASGFLINFLLLSRLMGYTVLDYREDPDVDNYICQNKINKKLIEMNIMLLKTLYHDLLSFKQQNHFDIISRINKSFTLIDGAIDKETCDKFDSAISLLYVVINTIIKTWNSLDNDDNDRKRTSRWSLFDPWPVISRHIRGFGSMELEDRQKIINNLTIFRKEIERSHDFSRLQAAAVETRLYRQSDNFFK